MDDGSSFPRPDLAGGPTAESDTIWDFVRKGTPPALGLLELCIDADVRSGRSARGWDNLITEVLDGRQISSLPLADGIVMESGLERLLARSLDHATRTVKKLLQCYRFIILDLCSWSETEDPVGWKSACVGNHQTDIALRRAVLGGSATYFKLGRIRVNGGLRTVYRIYSEAPQLRGLVPLQTFQRNHASWPNDKRLLADGALPASEAAGHVSFVHAVSPDGDRYWVKSYLGDDAPRIAALEQAIGQKAALALETLRRLQPPRAAMLELMLPISVAGGSLIFPYDPCAVTARPCHLQDWSHFLPPDLLRSVSILAALHVSFRALPSVSLHNLCDFQVMNTGSEAMLLDFEPNPWVLSMLH